MKMIEANEISGKYPGIPTSEEMRSPILCYTVEDNNLYRK